jgi:glycosyltransferase involved in cell wall biosynthesis
MKIGIDIQALQSEGSRDRGIGRYTQAVVEGLVSRQTQIEYAMYASKTLPQPSVNLNNIPCQWINFPDHVISVGNDFLMKAVILSSKAEAVLFPSPLQGNGTTIPSFTNFPIKIFTICYDLIPLIFAKQYLSNEILHNFYMRRLNNLKHADLVFAISEATRQDTIKYLDISSEKVINISSGVSSFFRPIQEEHSVWHQKLKEKFNITKPFVMYTGGEDWRKNLGGLVSAFGLLPQSLRSAYQLVIACKLSKEGMRELTDIAAQFDMKDALVLTNFVSDEELRALYSICSLFVFPSFYEGFGLPVLEAMACGAPTLAGNNSSLPEIIGNQNQLFDASSPDAIAASIQTVLTDENLRLSYALEAPRRAALFTWDKVAQRVEQAMLASHYNHPASEKTLINFRRPIETRKKPSVAFFSPLPPAKSGIADYSANLLPALGSHMDIDVFYEGDHQPNKSLMTSTQWRTFPINSFESAAIFNEYEILLYQIGNSENHNFTYSALMRYPGITVLHDYHLGGLITELSKANGQKHLDHIFLSEFIHSYGMKRGEELAHLVQQGKLGSSDLVQKEIFINRRIFTRSLGVIVHSKWAYDRAIRDFQSDCENITFIPLLMPQVKHDPTAKQHIRQRLGIPLDSELICSFGIVGHAKRPLPIVRAFQPYFVKHPNAHLVFVGAAHHDDAEAINSEAERLGISGRVHITGFVEMSDFHRYIQAADICLNLRFPYHGETSAALLYVLAHGKPVVVTDIGSFSEFPDDVVLKVPQPDAGHEEEEIYQAMMALSENPTLRHTLSVHAVEYTLREHSPEHCASLYAGFVQKVINSPSARRKMLADYVGREAVALRLPETTKLFQAFAGTITQNDTIS